jgi:predicted RNA-binding Zn-ribbon protein involved in translation (DUF1610 family)
MTEQVTQQAPQTDRDAAYDKLLAAYLAGRDTACTSCNYNLRNVTSGACPECGEPITISLGRADRSTLPWFVAVIAYAAAAAISGLWLFIMMMIILFEFLGAEEIAVGFVSLCAFLAALVVLILIIRRRHAIWSWSTMRQWWLPLSVLLLVPLVIILMMIALAIAHAPL